MSIWSGRSASDVAVGLAAEAILLLDDARLADRIKEYLGEVQRARGRVAALGVDLKERERRNEIEYNQLKQGAREARRRAPGSAVEVSRRPAACAICGLFACAHLAALGAIEAAHPRERDSRPTIGTMALPPERAP